MQKRRSHDHKARYIAWVVRKRFPGDQDAQPRNEYAGYHETYADVVGHLRDRWYVWDAGRNFRGILRPWIEIYIAVHRSGKHPPTRPQHPVLVGPTDWFGRAS